MLALAAEGEREPTLKGSYGTRLSTVILIRRDGSATFIERDVWALDEHGRVVKRDSGHDRVFRFAIQPPGASGTGDGAREA